MSIKCMKVAEVVGIKPQQDGDVGIEIEVEYPRAVDYYTTSPWMTKSDGSLRYSGYEYITAKPIPIKSIDDSLKHMIDYINKNNPIIASPRTSVHVHVNTLDHTAVEYCNALLIGWLLENAMVKYCEPKLREGNLFCLRAKDAESTIVYAMNSLSKVYSKTSIANPLKFKDNQVRYSAQNYMSTGTFGTIEYRSMAGIYETKKISTWAKALHTMVESGKKFESPEDVFNFYLRSTPEEFVYHILGAYHSIVTDQKDWQDLISEQEGMLANFAYMTDWKDWADQLAKRIAKLPPPSDKKIRARGLAQYEVQDLGANAFVAVEPIARPMHTVDEEF